MARLESVTRLLLLILVALLPFEVETGLGGLSILQLAFFVITVVAIPILLRDARRLVTDRLILAGAALVAVFWISAALADGYQDNAFRGAIRITCGWVLLCIASRVIKKPN